MAKGDKSGMDPNAFSQYLTGIYGGGCVMLSVAIGHELGLFKAICEAPGPFSLEGIAGKLKFKPRYTKEWLSTMVAAGILHQDRDSRLFTVPEGHKPALLRDTGFAPILFSLAAMADLIKKCFQENGPYGISYAESPEWFEWFNDFRSHTGEHTMNSEIVPMWKLQSDIIPRLGDKSGMDPNVFSQYLTGIYQGGCVMLSVAIGHELGLFKAICEAPGPFSLEGIAGRLKFKLRYTKEWLSTIVAAGVLHQDRDSRLYTVPEGHKPTLLRNTGFAPLIFILSARADLIKKCFQEDGPYGINYAESPEWFEWFNSYRSNMGEHTVNSEIVPMWKQQAHIVPRLDNGINVLDLGCGPGNYSNIFAQRFPNSTFVGLDCSEAAIEIANREKADRGLSNVTFVMGDAHKLPDHWTADFDMVFVYDVLHDLTDPYKVLKQIHRVLQTNGFLSLIDFGFHSDPVDNAGDMTAAMYYSCSVFRLLASRMTEELWLGFGACWGSEEIQKAILGAGFKINGESSLVVMEKQCFFNCTK